MPNAVPEPVHVSESVWEFSDSILSKSTADYQC